MRCGLIVVDDDGWEVVGEGKQGRSWEAGGGRREGGGGGVGGGGEGNIGPPHPRPIAIPKNNGEKREPKNMEKQKRLGAQECCLN